ncbi:MAG TPA: rod shape-determining protein MreC [Tepidisphaeraceae bacterium]|nr:rod shape-determining protein MreC [Tepidisphaeraceae bacterium]
MSYLKIQHVFFGLMAFSAILAFVVPARYASRVVPQMSMLYAPVSRPVAGVAGWVSNRVAPPGMGDRRAAADIRQENQQLRSEVARLRMQIIELARRDSELAKLGDIKSLCKLVKVIGGDSGPRQSILLAGSSLQGLKPDMYVLHPGGLVGQIQRVSAGGAQVRLVTDPGFHIRIRFFRFQNGVPQPLPGIPMVVAQGDGKGSLVIRALSLEQIGYDPNGKPLHKKDADNATLVDGDYALVNDTDSPAALTGVALGRVSRISYRTDARLFADIRIHPTTNLEALPEVMVLMKEQ